MQTKEVTKMLGINRERIKYFKRQGVFIPESSSIDNKNVEYTENDVDMLRKLVVLTKCYCHPIMSGDRRCNLAKS